jgi:uncharacterized membrane protein YkvA (DUF1232 family)
LTMAEEVKNTNEKTPSAAERTSWWNRHVAKGKEGIAFVLMQARVLTLLMKHPRASWASRAIALCTVSYLLSPIQLIPTFIPVIGQLDDLFVLLVGMKLIRRLTPDEVLADCQRRAESPLFRNRTTTEVTSDAPAEQTAEICAETPSEALDTVPRHGKLAASCTPVEPQTYFSAV